MMPVVRRLISWTERARANELPTMAVGGVPIPPPVARPDMRTAFPCHDCPEVFRDGDAAMSHMWHVHGTDRRKAPRERRAA